MQNRHQTSRVRFQSANPAQYLHLSQEANLKFREGIRICQSRAAHLLKAFTVKNGIPGLSGHVVMNHSKAFDFAFGYRDIENLVGYSYSHQVRIGQLTMPLFFQFCKTRLNLQARLTRDLSYYNHFSQYRLHNFLYHNTPVQDLTNDDLLILQTPLSSCTDRLLNKLESRGRFLANPDGEIVFSRLGYILAAQIASTLSTNREEALKSILPDVVAHFQNANLDNFRYEDSTGREFNKNRIDVNYDDTIQIIPNLSRHYRSIGNMLANVTDINPKDFGGAYGLTCTTRGLVHFCQNLLVDQTWHELFNPLPIEENFQSNPGNEDWERCLFGYTQKSYHDTIRKVYKESFDMGSSAAVLIDGLIDDRTDMEPFIGKVSEQYGTIVGITCNLENQKLYNLASKIAADFDKLQEDFWDIVTEGGLNPYPRAPFRS